MKDFYVNDGIKINHPLADRISVQTSRFHYASENTSEVALFLKGKFQTVVVDEFAEYADGEASDTLVYGFVPNEIVDEFLETYRA